MSTRSLLPIDEGRGRELGAQVWGLRVADTSRPRPPAGGGMTRGSASLQARTRVRAKPPRRARGEAEPRKPARPRPEAGGEKEPRTRDPEERGRGEGSRV